ncbi:WhiB family transcriptional regulator [Streptomyces sp. B1I3]|uniref:WhiB family transcriptional regulator n=1 Tax=Streptomyces sp. B1I3 TaxID=3042264 RepID=UPI00278017C2|nr:WhiB family transcriptional regulator [Streptomyces sp. B1I3]MDQ0792043.1 WhiB family redox-sensing transcriptional regulator [Streptomyces sp. B1I3]
MSNTWEESALCAQTDPDAWHPLPGGTSRPAKQICGSCEVRAECLEYAISSGQRFGIWGGASEKELRQLARARQEQAA